MSEKHQHDRHDHDPVHLGEHGHGHDDGASHGSLKSYTIGFVLAVILTVIPFWLVMDKVITNTATLGLVLLALAGVQIVVHMIYFLHMNTKSEGGWNMLALLFTGMVLVIMLSGSIWVMYHLDHNMMPGMTEKGTQQQMQDMRNMP